MILEYYIILKQIAGHAVQINDKYDSELGSLQNCIVCRSTATHVYRAKSQKVSLYHRAIM